MAYTFSCSEIESCGLPRREADRRRVNIPALIDTLWPPRKPYGGRMLDLRDLPDHIRRDIGILDGNLPSRGVKW